MTTDDRSELPDAVEFLLREHRMFEEMFARYDRLGDDVDAKRHLFREIVAELSVHEAIEEIVVWPEVRASVPGGDELADRRIAEEDELKHMLAALDRMSPADAGFDAKLKAFGEDVLRHAREEEEHVFPALRQHVEANVLKDMGAALEVGDRVAPTRPHPQVPSGALAQFVAGGPAAVLDRVRDAIEQFRARG